jgi:hypothetical protein
LHRFDKIKFSHPKASTKALRTSLHDSPSESAEHDLEADVPTILAENRTSNVIESVHHVTRVQESDCDVQQWHIRRVPSMGKKVCFAMQTRTGRKCIQKLPLSIHAPTYFGFYICEARTRISSSYFTSALTILQGVSKVLDASGYNLVLMFLMFGQFKEELTLTLVKL